MRRTLPFFVLSIALSVAAPGARGQFDVNGPNAAIFVEGVVPSASDPATHDVFVASGGFLDIVIDTGANILAPIILLASPLDPTGPVITTPWGGSVDIGFNSFGLQNVVVLGDGVGLTTNPLTDPFFVSDAGLPPLFILSYPVTQLLSGFAFAIQGIVRDPSAPPFFFDNTEAADINFTNAVELTGDEEVLTYFFPSGPYSIYGQSYSSMQVSTNGWIKFGGGVLDSDFATSTANFLSGNVGLAGAGSGPIIAVLWDDLNFGNGVPGQRILIEETSPGITSICYDNADYFPADPLGCFYCDIDATTANTFICMGYPGYIANPVPARGLVGVSDGNTVTGNVVTAWNFFVGGVFNPFPPGASAFSETVFQNFSGAGAPAVPAEPFDIGGCFLGFLDTNGFGQFITQ